MKKLLLAILLISSPAWSQTKPLPRGAAARVDNCAPIGRTEEGKLVYSMKCENLPAPPLPPQAETRDASLIWEGHKAGRHIGYCHIEKLHNLEQLPSTGFTVSCFPVKIERASAGWTRAVAIIDG